MQSALIVFIAICGYYYYKYQGIVDARLKEPLFANTAKIYAAPREVRPGQKLTVHLIAKELRHAGYTADGAVARLAAGHVHARRAEHHSASWPESFHAQDAATIHISDGVVEFDQRRSRAAVSRAMSLEPLLITGLSEDANRTKRRLLKYDEIPPEPGACGCGH